MESFLTWVLIYIVGFITGGWCIYAAFERELKSGKVTCYGKVYSSRIIS